jgi:hypothetical protein
VRASADYSPTLRAAVGLSSRCALGRCNRANLLRSGARLVIISRINQGSAALLSEPDPAHPT